MGLKVNVRVGENEKVDGDINETHTMREAEKEDLDKTDTMREAGKEDLDKTDTMREAEKDDLQKTVMVKEAEKDPETERERAAILIQTFYRRYSEAKKH